MFKFSNLRIWIWDLNSAKFDFQVSKTKLWKKFENVKKFPGVANDIGNNFAKAIFQILMSFGLGKKDKFLDLTSRSEI